MSVDNSKYIGKYVEIKGKGNIFSGQVKGIVIPNENKGLIVLKLDSGYNVAVKKENISEIKVLGTTKRTSNKSKVDVKVVNDKDLPKVGIISLGGTIASKVDYTTGGVSSQFTAEDLVTAIPEIKSLANLECISLYNKFSENITRNDWCGIAKKIESLAKENYKGFVITMGTDLLHYSAAALSFLLEEINFPVVFVGAQRSSDRPSSDSAYNLIGALTFIKESKKAGVFVSMHHTSDDKLIAINLGTKVRKLHSSRRDAFKAVNLKPVALIDIDSRSGKLLKNEISFGEIYDSLPDINGSKVKIVTSLSDHVSLIKYYPDMDTKLLEFALKNYKALIIEGSGFGHISDRLINLVKKYKDTLVFMTTQTIFGRVNLDVYTQGRKELAAGIIPLGDMLSETAYAKACYVLAKTNNRDEIIKLMTKNLKGEINNRSLYIE